MALATSMRLLELLGLLQSRPVLTGPELVTRLRVTDRTLRKDIARLRELGYPVDAVRGPGGGYRLGTGGQLPPLLLTDDEAVAIAVSLSALVVAPGLADAAQAAQVKLQRTLPDKLRRRVAAMHSSLEVGPMDTGTNAPTPEVDPAQLSRIAAAIAAREGLRFAYRDAERPVTVDPYRLVSWRQRWYLAGRARPEGDWQVYRTDLMALRSSGGSRFAAQPLAGGDYAALVLRTVASTGWKVHARIRVDAAAEEVLGRINPAVGVVETVDAAHCVLVTGADTLETVAVYIGMLGLDFHVDEPAALVDHLATLSGRYAAALPDAPNRSSCAR
jgi:predicted DNA-binding transcriptional regulator YafY